MSNEQDKWFSRYRFCQLLGQGGMGMIYLAEDRKKNNCLCVIKQMLNKRTEPEDRDEAIRLFKREVTTLQTLNHPGIVRFFDHHTTSDGRYFLVMDYVPGKNLEVMLNEHGPFSCEATIEIAIQCCHVLEYLHNQEPSIIYRDLKPSNLMLTSKGQIIFVDFGIARSFMPKQLATQVVSAGYSPPEQYSGKPEIRSDLYALGATLGYLLSGQKPKPLSVSTPIKYNPLVSTDLNHLIGKLTSYSLDERPPSAKDVRHALYRIYHDMCPDFKIPKESCNTNTNFIWQHIHMFLQRLKQALFPIE